MSKPGAALRTAPPPSATAIAVVGPAMWLFPAWGAWIVRAREMRQPHARERP